MTYPFIYETGFTNGYVDISIDFFNEKWNLFITGVIDGYYFSYVNIDVLNSYSKKYCKRNHEIY
jgi:hypothetical protein